MSPSDGILLSRLPRSDSFITVGNGSNIPTSCRGTSTLSAANTTFHLNNVLVAPTLVRNLLSVRQFTRDNLCSIEFDALVFFVKDLQMGRVILRCNSGGDLYTITPMPPPTCSLATSACIIVLVTRVLPPSPPYRICLSSHVISSRGLYVMPINLANTPGSHSVDLLLSLPLSLSYFTVMYGHPLF